MSARPNVTLALSGEESQLVHEAADALAVPPEKLLAAAAVAFARLCGFRKTASASVRRAPSWGPQPAPEIPEAILEVSLDPESVDQVEAAAGYVRWEGPEGPLPVSLSEYVVGATTRLIRETRSEGSPPSYRGLAEQLFNLAPRPRGESAFRASLGGTTTSAVEVPLPFEAPAVPSAAPPPTPAPASSPAPTPAPNRPAYTLPRPARADGPERPEATERAARPSYTLPRRAPAEGEVGRGGPRGGRERTRAAPEKASSPRSASASRAQPSEPRSGTPPAKSSLEVMAWIRQRPLIVGASAAAVLLLVLLVLAYSAATAPPSVRRTAASSAGPASAIPRGAGSQPRLADPLRLDPPPKNGETAEGALKRWEDIAPGGPEVPATPFRRGNNHGKNIDALLNERYGRPKVLADASLKPEAYDADIAEAVADVVHIYPVPPALVKAVIRRESNFNPNAVSQVGAIGMMQLMPYTAKKVGLQVSDLWVPKKNILGGTRLLSALLQYYEGDVISVLTAYNARPREPLAPLPKNGETPEYVAAVLRYYEEYTGAPLQESAPRNSADTPLRPGP